MDFITKARRIAALALEKNAVDPTLLHITELCSYTDVIVICHGRSTRQVRTIMANVVQEMKKEGLRAFAVEGEAEGMWVLADYGDVVLHVFYEAMRPYYDLEGIYPDAPKIDIEQPASEA